MGDGILDDERFEGGAEVLWIWRIAVAEAGITGHPPGDQARFSTDNRFEGDVRFYPQ